MKPQLHNKYGSAYLVILATIVVAMFLLMASMQRSVDSSKQTFSIENHTIANNALNSCITYIFHHIKTWPFDNKAELVLPQNNISIEDSSCKFELINSDLRTFEFEVTVQYKELTKTRRLFIKGNESRQGIEWNYSLE